MGICWKLICNSVIIWVVDEGSRKRTNWLVGKRENLEEREIRRGSTCANNMDELIHECKQIAGFIC